MSRVTRAFGGLPDRRRADRANPLRLQRYQLGIGAVSLERGSVGESHDMQLAKWIGEHERAFDGAAVALHDAGGGVLVGTELGESVGMDLENRYEQHVTRSTWLCSSRPS